MTGGRWGWFGQWGLGATSDSSSGGRGWWTPDGGGEH